MEQGKEYYAGDVIEATLALSGGDNIRSVIATFVNESNPSRIVQMCGKTPEIMTGVMGVQYQTVLRYKVAASGNWAYTGVRAWKPNATMAQGLTLPRYPTPTVSASNGNQRTVHPVLPSIGAGVRTRLSQHRGRFSLIR